MAFIINLVIQLVIALIIATIFSKPQDTARKPAGIGDFDFPTASQSRSIPVVWGRQEMKAPNQVWAGDFGVEKVTTKVRTGLSKKSITVGYKYFVGMQLALCMGGGHGSSQIASVTKLRFGDKVAWEGTALPDVETEVNNAGLYGGEKGGGGIVGAFVLHGGARDQAADTYLAEQQGEFHTPHSEVAYITWLGYSEIRGQTIDPITEETVGGYHLGYIGTSTNLQPMRFTVNRYPNTLNVTGGKEKIGIGCNPACMIHELLTDQVWGMGWNDVILEVDDLTAMADTLYDEEFGLCMTWDNEKSIDDMLGDILQHIGGYYYEDKITGKIRFGLYRDDYDVETLDELGRPDVLSVGEYSRTGWEGSINEVSVSYSDEDRNFDLNLTTANDIGNSFIQEKPVSRSNNYHGITDKDLATKVAYRDLRSLSLPLARATLICNRLPSIWEVGKVFKWTEPSLNIESVVMRVTKVDRGNFDSLETQIHCVEDIYGLSDAVFSTPTDNEWVAPDTTPAPVTDFETVEVPKGISASPDLTTDAEVLVMVSNEILANLGFNGYIGTTSGELFTDDDNGTDFNGNGLLFSALSMNDAAYDAAATILVSGASDLPDEGLGVSTDSMIRIGNEWICYDRVARLSNGLLKFEGIYRGMMNTTVQSHSTQDPVYFYDGGGLAPVRTYTVGETLYYKIAPYGISQQVDLGVVTEESHAFYGEKARPYVLTEMRADGEYAPEPLTGGALPEITWHHNPRDTEIAFNASNAQNLELLLDTTYTYTLSDSVADLYTEDIVVSAGDTAEQSVQADYNTVLGTATTLPPYLIHLVGAEETTSTEASTYRAAKLQEVQAFATAPQGAASPLHPQADVILFDGEHFGVTI